MKAHLFFNPAAAAGRSAQRLGAALASLRTLGADIDLHRPASAELAREEMRALAGETERVIVVGGDGMVHQAANALAGSTTVLGIIEAGTGNDTVRSFGLPSEIEQACAAALADPEPIDLIAAGDDVAVTVATSGFSVAVNERADGMQRLQGSAKYAISSLIELPKLTTHPMTLIIDDTPHEIEANLVAVANTAYFGGGMNIAPDAVADDGLLDVVVMRVELSPHDGSDATLRADGEPFTTLPATLTTRPGALLIAGL